MGCAHSNPVVVERSAVREIAANNKATRDESNNNAVINNVYNNDVTNAVTTPPPRGTYKAAVIREPGAKFTIEERVIPIPQAGEVLIKVAACGICNSDKFAVNGLFPGVQYPLVPGHEVIGTIEEVGAGVEWPTKGMLVGVGWHGSHCLFCINCRKGDFMMCPRSQQCITGIYGDGGYAEYMIAHWTGVAEMPEGIDPADAAPLLCAGVTVFNGMRHQKDIKSLKVGDLVAIQGIGGLGHLAIQFAKKMGYKVAAISSSAGKEDLATELGADYFVDASKNDASQRLLELGGAKLIVATAPNAKCMSDLVNGLGVHGRLLLVGADQQKIEMSPVQVLNNRARVCGWSAGIATDSSDACRFAQLTGIKSINEQYTLDQVQEAYDHMLSGNARFRVVIKMQ